MRKTDFPDIVVVAVGFFLMNVYVNEDEIAKEGVARKGVSLYGAERREGRRCEPMMPSTSPRGAPPKRLSWLPRPDCGTSYLHLLLCHHSTFR